MLYPVSLIFQQFVQNRCYFLISLQFVYLFYNLSSTHKYIYIYIYIYTYIYIYIYIYIPKLFNFSAYSFGETAILQYSVSAMNCKIHHIAITTYRLKEHRHKSNNFPSIFQRLSLHSLHMTFRRHLSNVFTARH